MTYVRQCNGCAGTVVTKSWATAANGLCGECERRAYQRKVQQSRWNHIADKLAKVETTAEFNMLCALDFAMSQKLANWTPNMVKPELITRWGCR